jgi:hypothetical protein
MREIYADPASNGSVVAARFLEERMREPLLFSAAVFALALIGGMALVRGPSRAILFFFSKLALMECVVTFAWAELATGLPIFSQGACCLIEELLVPGLLLLAAALTLSWSLHDQGRRCPVCCGLLSMPALQKQCPIERPIMQHGAIIEVAELVRPSPSL